MKEPLGKKGLGNLMSVLHENAHSFVSEKLEQNGPNQILAATDYTTTCRSKPVKLRKEEYGLGSEEPISVPALLEDVAESYPDIVAIKCGESGGEAGSWKSWTYRQLYQDVQTVAKGFIELGLHRHHSVALLGSNSAQWVIANFAAIFAGGIAVGVYPGLNEEDIARVALDTRAEIIVVHKQTQLKKVLLVQHKLPDLKAIIQLSGDPPLSDKKRLQRTHKKQILSWEALVELGAATNDNKLDERLGKISMNSCCTMLYTSGTHQPSRPVMFSHDNLTWTAKMTLGFVRAPGFNKMPVPGEEIILSYSPLCEISAQIIDIYYSLSIAATTVFPVVDISNNYQDFCKTIQEVKPSLLCGPPRMFEMLHDHLRQIIRSESGVKKFLLDWCTTTLRGKQLTATANTNTQIHSQSSNISNIQHAIVKKTVCKKYKGLLGISQKTVFICRGSSLSHEIQLFLSGFDIIVHTSYGQSETCGFHTANVPKRYCKFSTEGKSVPGVKTWPNSCGAQQNTQIRGYGRNIFMGYLNKENETKAKVDGENWVSFGDLGHMDGDGFLVVDGRSEHAITLATGDHIFPEKIENAIRLELPCCRHVLVIGSGMDHLACILSLDTVVDEAGVTTNQLTPRAKGWFRAARFDVNSIPDVISDLDNGLNHVIQAGIDRANEKAERSSHMMIEWRILSRSFSFEGGELGQTMKLKRDAILEKYGALVKDLYSYQTEPGHKHSNTGVDPFPHQLTLIVEEEERESSGKSPDLDDTQEMDPSLIVEKNSRSSSISTIKSHTDLPDTKSDRKQEDVLQEKEKISRR